MDDIVVRLRGDLDMLSSSQMHALGEEAAREIMRLRAKVASLKGMIEEAEESDGRLPT